MTLGVDVESNGAMYCQGDVATPYVEGDGQKLAAAFYALAAHCLLGLHAAGDPWGTILGHMLQILHEKGAPVVGLLEVLSDDGA